MATAAEAQAAAVPDFSARMELRLDCLGLRVVRGDSLAAEEILLSFLRPSNLGLFEFAFQPVAKKREKINEKKTNA